MSIEVVLFVVIGALSVAAAVAMLLTDNAVHSALFLIVNFGCIAFLFLMLDASFLAMVQIAVYAGAIMVLFLFVIMLLGAEQTGVEESRQFKWLAPAALTLAASFLVMVSIAVISGEIDSREVPAATPMLRIAHVAPGFETELDVYLNSERIADAVSFNDVSDFVELPAGDYSISIAFAGDDPSMALPLSSNIVLEAGTASTAILFGDDTLPTVSQVNDDLSADLEKDARVIFFNAYTGAASVDLVDPGSDFIVDEGEDVEIYVSGLRYGESSGLIRYNEGEADILFLDADNPNITIDRLENLELEADVSTLVILASEPSDDGLRAETLVFATLAMPLIGGPTSIGQALFTDYVLPFQIVAMLLLAAMVGAIVLTQRVDVKPKPGRPTRRKVSRPLTSVIATQTGHEVSVEVGQPQLEAPQEPEPAGDLRES